MTWEVARAAVDFLLAWPSDLATRNLTFFGGEPLLEFHLMRQIATYADQRAQARGLRIQYACTTNGTLMTEEKALFGVKHGFNYLVSLDGVASAHNAHRRTVDGSASWDHAVRAVRLLQAAQGWTGVRMTVNPDTADRVAEGVRYLHGIGVNQFLIAPNVDVAWDAGSMAQWDAQLSQVHAFYVRERLAGSSLRINDFDDVNDGSGRYYDGIWGCDAGRTRVAVAIDGRLYPCSRFADARAFCLGSVWDGISASTARIRVSDTSGTKARCGQCAYACACSGCCPAVSFLTHGDLSTPHPLECAQSRFRAARRSGVASTR